MKSKFTYNNQEIAFDGEGSWNFGNNFARNVIIFSFDNSFSSHTDNGKNNFLVWVERLTQDVNDSCGRKKWLMRQKENLVLTLVK